MSAARDPLRIALFGLGHMGSHHLRAITEREDMRLVAVADHGSSHAREIARAHGCEAVEDPSVVVGRVDAAVIAVPTSQHGAVATPLLEGGVACLVEKPAAVDAAGAQALIDAAARGRAVLQVGLIERFNPALDVARALLAERGEDDAVLRMTAQRTLLPSDRAFDVDAVLDLMIHDLDLVGLLIGVAIADVDALPADCTFDRARATLTTGAGATIELGVDRACDTAVRDVVLETATQRLHVDLAGRAVRRRSFDASGPSDDAVVDVPAGDPLRRQLDAFVRAARRAEAPRVSGAAGRDALLLAERVRVAAGLAR